MTRKMQKVPLDVATELSRLRADGDFAKLAAAILRVYRNGNYSYNAIGEVLGMTPQRVRQLATRADQS